MFIHLDLGWMSHPFALSSFRIADAQQIEVIRSLGLARVRWSPQRSDAVAEAPAHSQAESAPVPAAAPEPARDIALAAPDAAALVQQQYAEAAAGWRRAAEEVAAQPRAAGQRMAALSQALVAKMLGARELSIRVLAATDGDRASHALNVGVLALLMGRHCGLAETELNDLGVGALAHDIGKLDLPARLHRPLAGFSTAETAMYRDHVARGVAAGQAMGLAPGALLAIAQHHEHADGSGFPKGLDRHRLSLAASIVGLVNRYDNLCHGATGEAALTPHEALSLLFTQQQRRFDAAVMSNFVRLMGVYPPGSLVQLTDDRFARVESVNAARPLKPRIAVHDEPAGEGTQAIDLAAESHLGIRRSLHAQALPPAARRALAPRGPLAWFFETEAETGAPPVANAAEPPVFPRGN